MWGKVLTILVLLVAAGPVLALPETITYEIITDESWVAIVTGYRREYLLEGHFQLVVDYDLGTAAFENVNVTIEEEITYWHYPIVHPPPPGPYLPSTDDLGELFLLTELESTLVTSTGIDFQLIKNIPGFPGADIYLDLIFDGDMVHIMGNFGTPVYDGPWYDLDATATVVPEPATILLLGFGGLLIRNRKYSRHGSLGNNIHTHLKRRQCGG
ncbi:MAG: PEP-CTERM sorting domain-containing protein [Planctomycetota bacterium]|jgi:hypothetical protein